jgi:molybdate transport system ATP-binding protein
MNAEPFLTLQDITVRVGGRWLLEHTHWQINRGEHWVIWGANGAGKTTLAKALMDQAAVVQGRIHRHYKSDLTLDGDKASLAMVTPEQYHHLYARAQLVDEMRHFSGVLGNPARAYDALVNTNAVGDSEQGKWADFFRLLDVQTLLAKQLEALSSGEMAKLLIARALASDPCLLILDEPFNGLDTKSREQFMGFLDQLAHAGIQLILITHRASEMADCITHVIHLDKGKVVWQGTRKAFKGRMIREHHAHSADVSAEALIPMDARDHRGVASPELIRMRNVSVRYGETEVLKGVNWTVHQGEHWALIGPNGAGKTTLLKLISGDNLQGYANELVLFGRRKGTGESVWQVKQQIGVVADYLQARYQRRLRGYDVVCSGFFDSVGLYRHCTDEQRQIVRKWIDILKLDDLTSQTLDRLSFGQQRLILIARAIVKSPKLLILDEPCNGLDQANRNRLMALLDSVAKEGHTSLLYVSHRSDEMPACISHRIFLKAGRVVAVETEDQLI